LIVPGLSGLGPDTMTYVHLPQILLPLCSPERLQAPEKHSISRQGRATMGLQISRDSIQKRLESALVGDRERFLPLFNVCVHHPQ
jgi:hypothetical protein